jgi:hypothetical protein
MTNREQPNGNLAVLLCALSSATGLGLSERMEHGLNGAYLGLRLADGYCQLNTMMRLFFLKSGEEACFFGLFS